MYGQNVAYEELNKKPRTIILMNVSGVGMSGSHQNFKILVTDGYRVPARKKFLGTNGYRVPGKFSLTPTPGQIVSL